MVLVMEIHRMLPISLHFQAHQQLWLRTLLTSHYTHTYTTRPKRYVVVKWLCDSNLMFLKKGELYCWLLLWKGNQNCQSIVFWRNVFILPNFALCQLQILCKVCHESWLTLNPWKEGDHTLDKSWKRKYLNLKNVRKKALCAALWHIPTRLLIWPGSVKVLAYGPIPFSPLQLFPVSHCTILSKAESKKYSYINIFSKWWNKPPTFTQKAESIGFEYMQT